jgi:hypothetical protein
MTMSELVYVYSAPRGSYAPELWLGPPYCGVMDTVEKNSRGNLRYPSLNGENVIKRIPIKESEEKLGFGKLTELYPLTEEELNAFKTRRSLTR